jgi:hypothetical protein
MPIRFWPRRSKRKQLESRVRRLEKDKKRSATTADVYEQWNDMTTANGLIKRIGALEKWQKETESGLAEIVADMTAAERKLAKLLPSDDSDDDDVDAGSDRSATASTSSSSSSNNVASPAASPILSPTETPVTFTRRKPNSAERVTLDVRSLQMPRPASA